MVVGNMYRVILLKNFKKKKNWWIGEIKQINLSASQILEKWLEVSSRSWENNPDEIPVYIYLLHKINEFHQRTAVGRQQTAVQGRGIFHYW